MATPSETLSPISNANEWIYFTLAGAASPGTIAHDGMKGFKREYGWDEKKGKGTQGATLTLKDVPPVKGSVTLDLITDDDFENWDDFVADVLSISPTKQQASGLACYHPSWSSIGLTQVVVKGYSAPEHKGKGKYQAVVEFIEWQKPPATSVVSTVDSSKPDNFNVAPKPQNPQIAALQAQIAALNQANKAAGRP